jgi:hypothetical protein
METIRMDAVARVMAGEDISSVMASYRMARTTWYKWIARMEVKASRSTEQFISRVRGGQWFGFGSCLLLAKDARGHIAEGFMGALFVVGCHPFVDDLADFN